MSCIGNAACRHSSALADHKERFVNARAEDYWSLRERFEQGEIDIDPEDDKFAAQLPRPLPAPLRRAHVRKHPSMERAAQARALPDLEQPDARIEDIRHFFRPLR